MARYMVRVRCPMSVDEAFNYMADLRNLAEWDRGVDGVEQLAGNGPAPDAVYDVAVKGIGGSLTLQYRVVYFDEPGKAVVRADSRLLTSVDTITVDAPEQGDGSVVTYDAELGLNGVLGLLDPMVGLMFNRIGDRAAKGLVKALDGERLD